MLLIQHGSKIPKIQNIFQFQPLHRDKYKLYNDFNFIRKTTSVNWETKNVNNQ